MLRYIPHTFLHIRGEGRVLGGRLSINYGLHFVVGLWLSFVIMIILINCWASYHNYTGGLLIATTMVWCIGVHICLSSIFYLFHRTPWPSYWVGQVWVHNLNRCPRRGILSYTYPARDFTLENEGFLEEASAYILGSIRELHLYIYNICYFLVNCSFFLGFMVGVW
jgi:hypothetical protein